MRRGEDRGGEKWRARGGEQMRGDKRRVQG
jgi:hypothetical protein